MQPVQVYTNVTSDLFRGEIVPAEQPALLKGLVAGWPAAWAVHWAKRVKKPHRAGFSQAFGNPVVCMGGSFEKCSGLNAQGFRSAQSRASAATGSTDTSIR